jgi:hypothetical protein
MTLLDALSEWQSCRVEQDLRVTSPAVRRRHYDAAMSPGSGVVQCRKANENNLGMTLARGSAGARVYQWQGTKVERPRRAQREGAGTKPFGCSAPQTSQG